MTTDFRVVSAIDLTTDNEVMNLRHICCLQRDCSLAGVRWFVINTSASEALQDILKFIYHLIIKKLPKYRVWLLIGSSAWQPDTRLVRYYNLWGALAARGIKILHSCCAQEIIHEAEGKLKFFGAAQLSELSIESVVKAILNERCTYIAALPSTIEIEDILDVGWSGDIKEDSRFLDSIISRDGLLIQQIGEFDDEEKGFVAIGRPKHIMLLLQ